MKNVFKIIKEEIEKYILKEFSNTLYHVTDIQTLLKILKTDSFKLSKTSAYFDSGIDGTETDVNGKINGKYKYYISFTRQPNMKWGYSQYFGPMVGSNGGIFEPENGVARIQFDGDLLGSNFKGEPVDYYSVLTRQTNPNGSYKGLNTGSQDAKVQNEDRLFSNKQFIKNISKYIIIIDVYPIDENEAFDVMHLMYHNPNFTNKIKIHNNFNDLNKIRKN